MNKSLKVVLLSLLVYPGFGHLFLKKYWSGLSLTSCFSIPLFLVISDLVNKTNQVIAQIEKGEIPLDLFAITESTSNIMSGADIQGVNIKLYVMTLVWIIAALDAYRLSRL